MRITINYFEGYPELQADLARHPARARAERMRFLAAMGLILMNEGLGRERASTASGQATEPLANEPTHPAVVSTPSGNAARIIAKRVFGQAEDAGESKEEIK